MGGPPVVVGRVCAKTKRDAGTGRPLLSSNKHGVCAAFAVCRQGCLPVRVLFKIRLFGSENVRYCVLEDQEKNGVECVSLLPTVMSPTLACSRTARMQPCGSCAGRRGREKGCRCWLRRGGATGTGWVGETGASGGNVRADLVVAGSWAERGSSHRRTETDTFSCDAEL